MSQNAGESTKILKMSGPRGMSSDTPPHNTCCATTNVSPAPVVPPVYISLDPPLNHGINDNDNDNLITIKQQLEEVSVDYLIR